MKFKRTVFVFALCILFLICYTHMASKIDPFARYSYINEENEEIIRKYITKPEDIDYIISLKIEPSSFLDFIELPNFKVKNILFYEACKNYRPRDNQEIIDFVNTYKDGYSIVNFELLIQNYTYETLIDYLEHGYAYFEDATLVINPSRLSLILDDDDVLMNYEPIDLIPVEPTLIQIAPEIIGQEPIYLREQAYISLKGMMEAFAKEDYELYKTLVLSSGYIRYEKQVELYEEASKRYDEELIVKEALNNEEVLQEEAEEESEEFKKEDRELSEEEKEQIKAEELDKIISLPGRSENQLGYTITLRINDISDIEAIEKSKQYQWLSEHAHEFGFIFRYPKDKENITNKTYQVLTLRYVGIENATEIYKSKKAFEEIKAKDE